jgi:glycosyltransferase involved in cell wall biosynthesis
MPKVLRIINRFNLGGPTYNAAYLTKYMAPEFETLLVGGAIDETEGNSQYILKSLGIEPLLIPEMKRPISPSDDYKAYKKIKHLIRKFKPDIVHTHASKAGALGRLAAAHLNVPVIIHTFHGHVFDAYFSNISSQFYINVERYLARKSNQIIALSDIQKHDLSAKYKICSSKKITIIPLGFDLSRFQENIPEKRIKLRTLLGIADDEIVISIVGRIVPIKNHSLFLDALKSVLERTTQKVKVLIVGDGEDMPAIISKTKDLQISYSQGMTPAPHAVITYTSWIKEVDEVVAASDIVALCSLNEGTPVSLIEAQAGNKPVVTTNVGGIENVVLKGRTALLSENNQMLPFADNLLRLIEDADMRQQYSTSGWDFVSKKFHYTRLVSDMKNLYYQQLKKV